MTMSLRLDYPHDGLRRLAGVLGNARVPLFIGLALAVMFGGMVVWLVTQAEETAQQHAALIPHVVVPIEGATTGQGQAGAEPAPVEPQPIPAQPDIAVKLAAAPAPGLVEDSRTGPLPRIATDGRTAWQTYARPFPASDKRPRIAIVMADMGLSGVVTGQAVQKLPGGVTLAFVPFAERLDSWIEKARGDGHEVLLSVPMEPRNYPRDDPGPNTLLTSLSTEQNIARLEWALSRVSGYVGVTSVTGGKFLETSGSYRPILDVLKNRGLLYLDSKAAGNTNAVTLASQIGLPHALADRVIDLDPARAAIDEQLRLLEETARKRGVAIGLGLPFPTTIERLANWLPTLADKGIALAPVSAAVNLQKIN